MDFYISKILWILFPPLNLVVLLLLTGLLMIYFRRRRGETVLWVGIFSFILCGVFPTGYVLQAHLEGLHRRADVPKDIKGILLLGGSFDVGLSQARQTPTLYGSGERATEALRLLREHPRAVLLFSGGNGTLDSSLSSEADVFRRFAEGQGADMNRVYYETRSRNTYENILFSMSVAHPAPRDTWVVVTSAAHMPRAIAVMRKQGWPGVILPYPVDYQTSGTRADFRPSADILGNFAAMHQAMREYMALFSYRIGGKIDSGLGD